MVLKVKRLWREEWFRTVVAVILVGVLAFTGSAAYDRYAGGPEARQAAVDADAVLDGFTDVIEVGDCVRTYSNAENVSEATLLIAVGSLVETAALNEADTLALDPGIYERQIQSLHDANGQFLRYLTLLTHVNERCDRDQPGGPQPLPEEDTPTIPSRESVND